MFKINKKITSTLLLLTIAGFSAHAKDRYIPVNNFLNWDDLFEEVREQFLSFGPSKEERKAIKAAREKLNKIHPTIEQKDDKVVLQVPIKFVDKQAINIQIEDGILCITIPTKFGSIIISVDGSYMKVEKELKVRKESTSKPAQAPKKDIEPKQEEKQETKVYVSSMNATVQRLPFAVDVQSAKAVTKDEQLTITFDKKQHAKIAIKHLK